MKLLTIVVCICLALVSFSHISSELATVRALGLAISPSIYCAPAIAALLSFLILSFRSKAGEFAGSSSGGLQFLRVLLVGIVWGLVWLTPEWYRQSKVTSVPVSAVTIERIDWQHLQSALDFKVVRVSSTGGKHICFPKAGGREQQLRSTLERFEQSMSKQRSGS